MPAAKTVALIALIWGTLVAAVQAQTDPTQDILGAPGTVGAAAATTTSTTNGPVDAYLNFGTGPNLESDSLTTGNARYWFTSPSIEQANGGNPLSPTQQLQFAQAVMADVKQTFDQSWQAAGQSPSTEPSLTIDPNVPHNHTISIVSGVDYGPNPGAIGITDVGHNGFSFVDNLSYANNLTDLEWAVAHNMTHELMHAFGVAQHDDQTGNYLDTATASWPLLINPGTTLSPQSVNDILAHGLGRNLSAIGGASGEMIDGDQMLASPVPEPSTLALWMLAGTAVAAGRHWRSRPPAF
jgi:hypothetical protein